MFLKIKFTPSQEEALEVLDSSDNVFLSGAAGSGKSFLLARFLKDRDRKAFPILASTGAAAILVGGRTFHSFFGLGIMEGGAQATVERALKNKRLAKRLREVEGIVIDEVSMLSGPVLAAAEAIAREVREDENPWGGLRIIAVGDFAQLPPVNRFDRGKEWAFLDPVWHRSAFQAVFLREIVRTKDRAFLEVLNRVREGEVDEAVGGFLQERMIPPPLKFDGTRLFARRDNVERFNLERLAALPEKSRSFETLYAGKEKEIEQFKKHAPIPEVIMVKEGALVMLRQNDVEGRWINGSLGHVRAISSHALRIELLSGREVDVEPADFTLLDAEGKPAVVASNFPVTLAWAVTIHKAQGTTLDRMTVDLRGLWEPGQAYVALSRARAADELYIEGWHPRSIFADPDVARFHSGLQFDC